MSAGDGWNTLVGNQGNDRLSGGQDYDLVDYSSANGGVTVTTTPFTAALAQTFW